MALHGELWAGVCLERRLGPLEGDNDLVGEMAAATLFKDMNTLDTEWPTDMATALSALPEGHEFTVPENLFAKIADDQREDWETRFAGTRD